MPHSSGGSGYVYESDGYKAKQLIEEAIADGAQIEIAVVEALRARHLNPVLAKQTFEEVLALIQDQYLRLRELKELREKAAKAAREGENHG